MKALVFHGDYDMRLEDIPVPSVGPGEVLVKVAFVGTCGSDVHGFAGKTGRRAPGVVMGHELSGVIERIGPGVRNLTQGCKVTVQPILYCGKCEQCRSGETSLCPNKKMVGINMGTVGGLSEYLAVPASNVFPVPQDLELPLAALTEPFAVGAGAVRKCMPVEGRTVVIVGAGVIGLTVLLMMKDRRPGKVMMVDKDDRKLKIGKKYGAIPINFTAGDPLQKILAETQGLGVDIAVEAVGAAASVQTAVSAVKFGGRIVWVGNSQKVVQVDMQDVVTRGKQIIGTYCYNDHDFQAGIDFIAKNRQIAREFVEQQVPPDQAPALFEQLARGQKELLRGMVQFA